MKAQPLITVRNVPASARFYVHLLGAQPGHGGDHYEQILIGSELVLQLHSPDADDNHEALVDTDAPFGTGVVLWFETDDFDALVARIADHGMPLDREPFENVYARQMECWLHDPDGYQIVIAGPSAYPRQPPSSGNSQVAMIDTTQISQVVPTPEMIRLWADELIPGDVWYWDDSPLDLDRTGCQVLTREAYRSDPTYNTIRFMNAYLEWQMPPEVTQVIVSDRVWIGNLSTADRQRVLQKQVDLKRGLVFAAAWFGELPAQLQDFVVTDQVVLGQAVWASLPPAVQHRALLAEQRQWDEVDCYPVPDDAPPHVRAIANTFSPHEGTNCFAIAAYGANADSDLLATWLRVSPIEIVAPIGYRQVPDVEPTADDIVIFELDGKVIHAAYCVGHDRFLHKNGQSRFNPVRIVNQTMLETDWPDTTMQVYRRLPQTPGESR